MKPHLLSWKDTHVKLLKQLVNVVKGKILIVAITSNTILGDFLIILPVSQVFHNAQLLIFQTMYSHSSENKKQKMCSEKSLPSLCPHLPNFTPRKLLLLVSVYSFRIYVCINNKI